MRTIALVGLAALPLLAGCDQVSPSSGGSLQEGRGRYAGIGIYEVGRLWSQVKVDPTAQAEGRASLADDEHVIVVVDNRTGEVRQCGDHSGICVAMNPWSGGSSATPLPVELTKDAAQLDAEQEQAASQPGEAAPAN
ncbi:MAG: hypothetical protein ABI617_06165 [Sphingomicrobium sp.]